MCSPLHLGAKHGVTLGAPVQLTLIAVLYSKVDLNVHLGIKDLLAQSTPEMGMKFMTSSVNAVIKIGSINQDNSEKVMVRKLCYYLCIY